MRQFRNDTAPRRARRLVIIPRWVRIAQRLGRLPRRPADGAPGAGGLRATVRGASGGELWTLGYYAGGAYERQGNGII